MYYRWALLLFGICLVGEVLATEHATEHSTEPAKAAADKVEVAPAELAVVIDDVGYNKALGLRAIELPGTVTLAVLPFAPHTPYLVAAASAHQRDIIVHQPMQPHPAAHVRHEHDTLTDTMTPEQLTSRVNEALRAVPGRIGMSNHAGSLLTQRPESMRVVMQALRAHGLFFLDSRTTAQTVAEQTARDLGLVALRRDVFLDHHRNPAAVAQAFNKVLDVARKQGSAVLVAHPYPVSLAYLEKALARMPGDVRLVSLGELALKAPARRTARRTALRPNLKHPAELVRHAPPASPHISLGR